MQLVLMAIVLAVEPVADDSNGIKDQTLVRILLLLQEYGLGIFRWYGYRSLRMDSLCPRRLDYRYLSDNIHWKGIISYVHFPAWILFGILVELVDKHIII